MPAETHGVQRRGEPLDLRSVTNTIPSVNQSWREYTGFSLEHLAPWGRQTVGHPDDISKFTDEWNVARAPGKPFETKLVCGAAMGNTAGSR
jgi:hypothetical protein